MEFSVSKPKIIAYDEHIYSSFPDVVRLPNNKLYCVYRESDSHHPITSKIILLTSTDEGKSWNKEVFQEASLKDNGYVFNCPRINFVDNKLSIICDTKSSQKEGEAQWNMHGWWSLNSGDKWSDRQEMLIYGAVPDHIVAINKKIVMAYHVPENVKRIITGAGHQSRLVQMVATSLDNGETWRDRATIATSNKHDFCEGSIVNLGDNKLICYMRNNQRSFMKSYVSYSVDAGHIWSKPVAMNIRGHRIVANIKRREPNKDVIIGTFRDTSIRSVSMFIHNLKRQKINSLIIDTEINTELFDFGYSGWTELEDGSILVVYYIRKNNAKPAIMSAVVRFQ